MGDMVVRNEESKMKSLEYHPRIVLAYKHWATAVPEADMAFSMVIWSLILTIV